ncbi:MAG: YqgE/AlgH family protein, partial [Aureliella sp.]
TAAINFGGPQAGPVVAVHDRRELAEFTSAEGVYFAAQIQNLKQLAASPTDEAQVKIIVGQADWRSGELDRQFAEGKWLPLPVSSGLVFADDSEMWPRAMHRVGDLVVASMSGARVCPDDVLTN